MPNIGLVFERRVSFWLAIGKLSLLTFIEKAILLRISLLIMGTPLILVFIFSLHSHALL
ncbi:hypothetical protein LINGRAHAP2_LOCUS6060 [Linum grandiflorum]